MLLIIRILYLLISCPVINRWVAFVGYLVFDVLDVTKLISNVFQVSTDATISTVGDIAISPESVASEIPTALGKHLSPVQ